MSEIRTVTMETTIRVPMNTPATTTTLAMVSLLEIGFRGRQQLAERIERDQRRGAPGRDRENLPHEAAHHREQAGDQHHREQDEIEYRYRHRLVRSARKSKLRIGKSVPP